MDSVPPDGMPREIQRWRPPGLAAFPEPAKPPSIEDIDVYGVLLADAKTPNTARARAWDLKTLAQYLGLADGPEAARCFCFASPGQANAISLGFRKSMLESGLAPGTINRRLCTLRRLVKLARRVGAITWNLEVDGLPEERYRDTRGPGDDGWRKILAVANVRAEEGTAKGTRDLAIIRLLHDSGLRISEAVRLDLADVDLSPSKERVSVVGKGKRQSQWISINEPTTLALAGWLAVRGTDSGPVFLRLSRARADGTWSGRGSGPCGSARLVSRGAYRIVRDLGEAAGVECRPHGLRHAGATRLLDLTNGDIRAVQRWTRHKDVRTVLIYDDNRSDLAGALAKKLGEDA